ncbi:MULTISPECIES: DUF2309 domain-containing protein [Gammaproteobacteria]|uniref:DUF2309 domain-containing protein n=1 Tax=Gammaproteobacteria TaxID=1236 RepID=UPI000DD08748|nr:MULTISPECIES: DUF2309 domain-containing protein [Gammaproteobacteria]RTE86023.1 DUF2309 domain-containing protein [Aliidiomarina sp. B3213]TCZ91377.1 DUF2309 domain-containing protein [Lysobacter sp. N42]
MLNVQTNVTWSDTQESAVLQACSRIAPTWPLDKSIAVNPWWNFKDNSYVETAEKLHRLAGVRGYMGAEKYIHALASGAIDKDCVKQAIVSTEFEGSFEDWQACLSQPEPARIQPLFSAHVDAVRDRHYMKWEEEITHQISQFCAAHFQSLRAMLKKPKVEQKMSLYQHWLEVTRVDYGLSIVLSAPNVRQYLELLPTDAEEALGMMVSELEISDDALEDFALACLYDIHGWASWVAYRQWHEQHPTGDTSHASFVQPNELKELLTIRLAWEWIVFKYMQRHEALMFDDCLARWQEQSELSMSDLAVHKRYFQALEVGALALEFSYQQHLATTLSKSEPVETGEEKKQLQAVFCIDVRSEAMRRALEQQGKGIETFGFAGFFGMPISYRPLGSNLSRPQLPGLLSPAVNVSESLSNQQLNSRKKKLNWKARVKTWSSAAASSFSMVESLGISYGLKLLKGKTQPNKLNDLSKVSQWRLYQGENDVPLDAQTDIAYGALKGIGIYSFAPTVLLVGHESQNQNNLHAASLDCGACCGQSGAINTQVLCQILNNTEVRSQLAQRGLSIPADTQFIPAIHNTTTDQISAAEQCSTNLQETLERASLLCRKLRFAAQQPDQIQNEGLESDKAIKRTLEKRATRWSEQRPERGLADNAAFVIAPRAKTEHLDFGGRAFMHGYEKDSDPDNSILELLMTAPMVVAHWINMQYNLSVCEPFKFGSGNKLLHNAVGGGIGVFEGNGGDLRIGLSRQSVHDGSKWLHTPQRLSVVIAAEQKDIESVLNKHPDLQNLVSNHWLHILQWQDSGSLLRFNGDTWLQVAGQ